MFKLIEKHIFEQQSGLIIPLKKLSSDSDIVLSSYLEHGDQCDIVLTYDDKEYDCPHVISFVDNNKSKGKVYRVNHPTRSYMEKWVFSEWNGKSIEWKTIVNKNLQFPEYSRKIIKSDKIDLRLFLHSVEYKIPVVTESFTYLDVMKIYNRLRFLHFHEFHFIHQLINIVGRIQCKLT